MPVQSPNKVRHVFGQEIDWELVLRAALDDCHPDHAQAVELVADYATRMARRIARRYACRVGNPQYQTNRVICDFVEEAPSIIFVKLKESPPSHRNFPAWCHVVLSNYLIDRFRRLSASNGKGAVLSETDIFTPSWAHDGDDDGLDGLPAPGGEQDIIEEVADPWGPRLCSQWESELPPLRRVIVLALTRLFQQVPRGIWCRWLKEIEAPETFPPLSVYAEESIEGRARMIGQELGMSPIAVRQHFYRALRALKRLLPSDGIEG